MATVITRAPDRLLTGIALRVGAVSCFAVMGAVLKLASTRGVVASELLFWRTAFGMPVVIGWVLLGPGIGAVATARPMAHLGRAVLGTASIFCAFQALVMLPLADATAINFTAPIFATLMSALLLRETVGLRRWAAVLIGFLGIFVVTRPGGTVLSQLGVALAVLAAIGQGSVAITLRHIAATERTAAIVFWFFIASMVAGGLLMPVFGRMHDGGTFVLLAVGGLAGGLGQILMTGSLQAAPVSAVAPFDYLQIVWAVALGWLLLGTEPGLSTLAGAALIAASGLYTAWREHRSRLDRGTAKLAVD